MPRHFKVHELLSREELDSLEAFTREPGRTVEEIETWLGAAGFNISRGAVWAWRTNFLAQDKFRASNEVARTLLDAAKNGDVAAISDAAALQLQQMVFEQLLKMQGEGQVETKELWAASMAMKNVIASQRGTEKLREEMKSRFDAQMQATAAKKPGGISAEDIAEARKAIFGT